MSNSRESTAKTSRHLCTLEDPWAPGKGRASHPDAREVGEQEEGHPGGDIVTYECPHCGVRWREELPQ